MAAWSNSIRSAEIKIGAEGSIAMGRRRTNGIVANGAT